MTSETWTKKVHSPIPVGGLDSATIRRAILEGMWHTRGYSWQLEKEAPGVITTRFDYRKGSIVFDIAYDAQFVRLKFADGNNGYECEKLDDGVCLDNSRSYFNYSKNLRDSIAAVLEKYQGANNE